MKRPELDHASSRALNSGYQFCLYPLSQRSPNSLNHLNIQIQLLQAFYYHPQDKQILEISKDRSSPLHRFDNFWETMNNMRSIVADGRADNHN
uniref:Uncharacterized protein n=1 Tax=Arundo donax TaxID=35708 RepID=A0A0A9C1N4_ARUDO